MTGWELRRCTNPLCLHEDVRERRRRAVEGLHCGVCGTGMVTLPLCIDLRLLGRRANGNGKPVGDPLNALRALTGAEQRLAEQLESDRVERVWHAGRTLAFAQAVELLAAAEAKT